MCGAGCRDRFDELELDVVAADLVQAGPVAEEDWREVDPDLVDVAGLQQVPRATSPPLTETSLSPAAALACRTALSTPSVTSV